MGPLVFIYFICAFGVIHKGLTAVIETQQTVTAAVGDEALLSCQLTEPKDVRQVTWQKSDGEKNVASYTKQFGERVNVDFRDKVKFKDAGLQSSSIIIRNVTEKDEGCYRCLFNTYPEGALISTTCLKVYELHEAVPHVTESNSPEETVVSCSVTGRPAPTVTLRVLKHNVHLSNYSSDSVTNTNGTVTVTTTAVLSGFHDNSTQVGCAVRVLSGPQTEVFMMIPEVKQTSADGFDEESGSNTGGRSQIRIIVLSVVGGCAFTAFIAVFILVLFKSKNQSSKSSRLSQMDQDMIEMSGTKVKDSQKTEAPQIRQQTTPEKNQRSDDESSPSSSPSSRLCSGSV